MPLEALPSRLFCGCETDHLARIFKMMAIRDGRRKKGLFEGAG
jgi:hypothetical protein